MVKSFSDKVKNGFTILPNPIFFLLSEGVISHAELIILIYVQMLNNFRRHKTSRSQLEKVLKMKRETISKNLDLLVSKNLIEIEPSGKFIIIHSNIEIEGENKIVIKSQKDQKDEFDKDADGAEPDHIGTISPAPQTDRSTHQNNQPAPQTDRLPAPQTDRLHDRSRGMIEVNIEKKYSSKQAAALLDSVSYEKICDKFKCDVSTVNRVMVYFKEGRPDINDPVRFLMAKTYSAPEFKTLIEVTIKDHEEKQARLKRDIEALEIERERFKQKQAEAEAKRLEEQKTMVSQEELSLRLKAMIGIK